MRELTPPERQASESALGPGPVYRFSSAGLGVYVELPELVCLELEDLCTKHAPRKVGGYLLGKYSDDRSTAIVSRLVGTTVGEEAEVWVNPDEHVKAEFYRALEEPEPEFWLGGFHTRPGTDNQPSDLDDESCKADALLHGGVLLLLIQSTTALSCTAYRAEGKYPMQRTLLRAPVRLRHG